MIVVLVLVLVLPTVVPVEYKPVLCMGLFRTMFRDTPLIPETSYGVCKNVIEMIVYDHARKGKPFPPSNILFTKPDQTVSFHSQAS